MSIEAIRAKLLPKFIATSRDRLIRAREAIAAETPAKIREEMHSITGDAGSARAGRTGAELLCTRAGVGDRRPDRARRLRGGARGAQRSARRDRNTRLTRATS